MSSAPGRRVYLDWNAGTPLRPEARTAMLSAMDVVGNPSSVHAEGRAAFGLIERARAAVARLTDCDPDQVVFTSGATEANNMAIQAGRLHWAATEHASIAAAAPFLAREDAAVRTGRDGRVDPSDPAFAPPAADEDDPPSGRRVIALAAANGETGVIEDVAPLFAAARAARGLEGHCDATQAVGRTGFSWRTSGAATAALSAHKIGGPKGVGALIVAPGHYAEWCFSGKMLFGGAQERNWRAGTENLIGIAGFGAAAEAAAAEREAGVWAGVAARRDRIEATLAEAAPDAIFPGRGGARLPNTLCVALPGWAGETQVMQLDLAGFAISAGAACSSGKVRASHVLAAMGYGPETAASAIRVSLGPTTTDEEADRFCETWTGLYAKRRRKAA
jgi:cysteine desulfurase